MINIPPAIKAKLIANFERRAIDTEFDPVPYLKIFTPWAAATWLVCEINPNNENEMFGLGDLGLGFPEYGPILLAELEDLNSEETPIHIDKMWEPVERISHYVMLANEAGKIEF